MRSVDELIIKTVKEIVVKFIEVGNISPSSFHDHFKNIYNTVDAAIKEADAASGASETPQKKRK